MVAFHCTPVSVLVKATFAPGTTAFGGSVTVPTMLLVITTWASRKVGKQRSRPNRNTRRLRIQILQQGSLFQPDGAPQASVQNGVDFDPVFETFQSNCM